MEEYNTVRTEDGIFTDIISNRNGTEIALRSISWSSQQERRSHNQFDEYLSTNSDEEEPNLTANLSASTYVHKLRLIFRLGTSLMDQIYDFYTIGILFTSEHYGFSLLFLAADLCPGLSVMWEKYKVEKSWKVVRFCFQPANLFIWNLKALFDERSEATFLMIKSVHSTLEAPLQILLTMTMMSMGVIELPGSERKSITNAYNILIDLSWLPIVSTALSFNSILFGTRNTFLPVREESNQFVSFVTFFPLFLFRMVLWIEIAIILERFTLFLLVSVVIGNTLILLLCQRKELTNDPVNCGCLSVVIPTWSVTALNDTNILKDMSPAIQSNSLIVLFGLVIGGNLFLASSFATIYLLYYFGLYNPWCNEELTRLRFEEELFQKSAWFIWILFCGATLPIIVFYFSKRFRVRDSRFKTCRKYKTLFVGVSTVFFISITSWFLAADLTNIRYAPNLTSMKVNESILTNDSYSGWSEWFETSKGIMTRERLCLGFVLQQVNGDRQDGGWGKWIGASNCDVTCGGGFYSKIRHCDNPTPKFGGLQCQGNSSQIIPCNNQKCPITGSWGEWSKITPCNVTCGDGYSTRRRICKSKTDMVIGKPLCSGDEIDLIPCNEASCDDSHWSPWENVGGCSVTCGLGNQRQRRTCIVLRKYSACNNGPSNRVSECEMKKCSK